MTGITRIEIHGQNDEYLCVHGDSEGNRGIYLGLDQVAGIYDAPEKQTWTSGARQIGANQRNRKIMARDMELGFMIRETTTHAAERNEAYLFQSIGYELDEWDSGAKYARLAITTEDSGRRDLDILQYEEPDIEPPIDPIQQQFSNPILKIRSGEPDWYEDDVITSHTFTQDGWGAVEVENPTPRAMWHKWVCTVGTWTLPDFSWDGPRGDRRPAGQHSDRYLTADAITAADGGLLIDVDRAELPARTPNGTNITARFRGQAFIYKIPAYTQRQSLPVYVADVPDAGAMVQLVQPRRWPRPWGGELYS